MSARRRELDGIRKKIPCDLLEPIGVALHQELRPLPFSRQLDLFCGRRRTNDVDRSLRDLYKINRLNLEPHFPRRDSSDVEQIIDQLDLGAGISLDCLDTELLLVLA